MALDQKALQKKRAKRELKRKQAKKSGAGLPGAMSVAHDWAVAAHAPIADCLVPIPLFEAGIGTVWVSRRLPDGRYALTGFLLDVFCLGVKNALYKIMEEGEYQARMDVIRSGEPQEVERRDAAYVRKLVEGALAYAQALGFDPHPDYRIARLIFGDIEVADCPDEFTFGYQGKPFYVNGPNETPAMQRRIMKQLEQQCGPGGSNFLTELREGESPF
ncbi:MAG TPA: hypothetical protein VES73_13050 [Lamprocystis sp. (in: g-proteobacteria)]|nr:hypothetical protein [Lamprocystis sp. (in: g-proteobacteria)]